MSDETRFLSNFYPYKKDGGKYEHIVKVIYNGIEFDCVENAYQAAKFLNKTEQMAFAKMSPYETKSFWENNSGFRSDWEQIKLSIMEDLVWQKFHQSDKSVQAWYYRSILKYTERLSNTVAWNEYKTLVEFIFGVEE